MFNVKTTQLAFATLGVAFVLSCASSSWAVDFKGLKCGMGTYTSQDDIDVMTVKMTERTSIANKSYYKMLMDEMKNAGFKNFNMSEPDVEGPRTATVTLENREQFVRFEELLEANNGHMAIKDFEVLEYETVMPYSDSLPPGERSFEVMGKLAQQIETIYENLAKTLGAANLTETERSGLTSIANSLRKAGTKNMSDPQAHSSWMIRDLVGPIDELRFFASTVTDAQAKNHVNAAWLKGWKLLKDRGVTEIKPVVGKKSQAWMLETGAEASAAVAAGKVTQVLRPAFFKGKYLLRPAYVVISSGPAN
ncbi:MAG: hypothetical protein JST80_01565 [Bdellovibrionales bacterium]|nr:hypothetical protein [Bdellovibrionales bacterium]